MTKSDHSIEVKPAASFSDVLKDKHWGVDLRKAAELHSVALIEADEQPAPVVAQPTPKSRGPR